MKSAILSFILLASVASVIGVTLDPLPNGVPPLYQVYTVNIPQVYGCSTYNNSALFTSRAGLTINRPDILFQGACGDPNPTFQINLSGDDFGVMTYVSLNVLRSKLSRVQ
jgi:hypothetical protein